MSSEALFQWSDDFRIGHTVIDQEHKYLFSLLQNLTDIVHAEREDRIATINILNQLLAYTQTHFQNEEELMERNNFAGLQAHQQNHDRLINQVEYLLEEFQEGEPVLTIEVLLFLKEWLSVHILQEDVQLVQLI